MKHFLFEIIDENSENYGEFIIIGACCDAELNDTIKMYFDGVQLRFAGKLTDEEAELSGLDEY